MNYEISDQSECCCEEESTHIYESCHLGAGQFLNVQGIAGSCGYWRPSPRTSEELREHVDKALKMKEEIEDKF